MKIEKDKIYHFLACMALVVVLVFFKMPLEYSAFLTLIVAIVGKEGIWDWLLKKGTPDLDDIIADIFGTFVGCILAILYLKLIVGV